MAKLQTNLSLSEDTLIKADQIMIGKRSSSGQNVSRSQLVTDLINAAYNQLKRIEPLRSAKGKTIGWVAYYGDHRVGEFDLLDKAGAQAALDAYVFEELSK